MNDTQKPETIVVVAELFQREIRPVTYELVCFAESLQQLRPANIQILLLGECVQDLTEKLARTTGKDVLGINATQLAQYNGQAYQTILHTVLAKHPPAYVCAAHSSRGWDFAPGLAARLGATCITGVNRVSSRNQTICFSRDIYGGKITADMLSSADTTVVTVQPGSYRSNPTTDQAPGTVDQISVTLASQASETVSTRMYQTSDLDLSEAKVIVSAGRGIGEAENLDIIRRLSSAIPQSVVCGSRPVIDLGWMPYDRQVGVTGASVSPDLYLACGISGAAQHVSGMQGSAFVVAINSDPTAAIFNHSDICIVADLTVFIPLLLEKLAHQ